MVNFPGSNPSWCYVAHRRIVAPSCYVLDIWRCAELMHSQTPWWRLLSQSPGTQDLPIAFNTMLSRQMTWRMIFAGASQGRNPQKDGVGNLKNHGQRIIYKQEGLAFSLWGVPRVHHYPIFRVELLLYWRVYVHKFSVSSPMGLTTGRLHKRFSLGPGDDSIDEVATKNSSRFINGRSPGS